MGHIRNHVEERIRTHLRKRHKVRDRKTGYVRFKHRALYERYGLHKVPTTAAWMRAHALQCRTSESRVRENRMHGLMREGRSRTCSLLYPEIPPLRTGQSCNLRGLSGVFRLRHAGFPKASLQELVAALTELWLALRPYLR